MMEANARKNPLDWKDGQLTAHQGRLLDEHDSRGAISLKMTSFMPIYRKESLKMKMRN